MKKVLVIIMAVGLLFTYGCSSSNNKKGELFDRDIYYNTATEVKVVNSDVMSEADMLNKANFVAKVKVVEADHVISPIHKNSGGGDETAYAMLLQIEELYAEPSGIYNTGDKLRVVSKQTIDNFNEAGINMQIGKEYIVFVELYSKDIISSLRNFTNNMIVDPVIGVIPYSGNEYIVNKSLTKLISLASTTKDVDITVNDNISKDEYLTTEILPLSSVTSNLTVIVEDNMKELITNYLAK